MKPKYFKINYYDIYNEAEYYIVFSPDTSYYWYSLLHHHWQGTTPTWKDRCCYNTPIEVSPLEIITILGIEALKEGEVLKEQGPPWVK